MLSHLIIIIYIHFISRQMMYDTQRWQMQSLLQVETFVEMWAIIGVIQTMYSLFPHPWAAKNHLRDKLNTVFTRITLSFPACLCPWITIELDRHMLTHCFPTLYKLFTPIHSSSVYAKVRDITLSSRNLWKDITSPA